MKSMKCGMLACWFLAFDLIVAGCRPSAPSISLHQAVQKGDRQAIQRHIAAGTDLNAKDRSGWSPIHLAVIKGDLEIVKALAAAGADVNQKGQGGKTPLDLARSGGKVAIAKFFLERPEKRGRGLVDGGLGVSEVLDNP